MGAALKAIALFIVFCSAAVTGVAGPIRRAARPIPNQYLVLLVRSIPAPEVHRVAKLLTAAHGGKLRLVMTDTANGFSVEMPEKQAIALGRDPRVVLVEENGYGFASAVREAPDRIWNLDRVDQRGAVTGGDQQYQYCELGSGVVA